MCADWLDVGILYGSIVRYYLSYVCPKEFVRQVSLSIRKAKANREVLDTLLNLYFVDTHNSLFLFQGI